MIDRHDPEPARRIELTEQDLAIATLAGCYIERRERHQAPCVRDLMAAATEFGDTAINALHTLIARYEAMRAHGDGAPQRH